MALYDVKVMTEHGTWKTDMVTGSLHRALERARFLLPRTPACMVEDQYGRRASL